MAESILPMRETPRDDDPDPECIPLEHAGKAIEALASSTARDVVGLLETEPMPASDLADRIDTSLQNVTYHLTRLSEAGLVDVVDTWYSCRGAEMDVYALTGDPVVICLGDEDSSDVASTVVEAQFEERSRPVGSD